MTDEIWKPVPSYPRWEASSLGRVRPLPREAPMPNGGTRQYKPKGSYGTCAASKVGARHSYMQVSDRVEGKTMRVHRMVCEAFHGEPPFADAVVIHLDEDSRNNSPDNLRWGTQQENLNMPMIKAYHAEVARHKFGRSR